LSAYRIKVIPETCHHTKLDIYVFIGLQNCKHNIFNSNMYLLLFISRWRRGRRGHYRMVVGFTTTYTISAYPH